MTADELVTTIRRAGGDLIREGDAIRYRGPRTLLTDDLRAAIRANRLTLLALVEPPEKVSSGTPPLRANESISTEPLDRREAQGEGDAINAISEKSPKDPRAGMCVFCPEPLAPGDLIACTHHRILLGKPGRRRCICGSTLRSYRPEWEDWTCSLCGLIAPSPEEQP